MSRAVPPATLWIISAPSGAGKTSLSRALSKRLTAEGWPTAVSVSFTTRAPRPGENEGEHYHFVDAATFATMIEQDQFLEYAEVFGSRYGTAASRTAARLEAGTDLILDIDWQGGRQIRARHADCRSVFILPPSTSELERRLRLRAQDSEATIASRMREAETEMAHHADYDYLIVNADFGRALDELTAIFLACRLRSESQRVRHQSLLRELLA